MKTKLLLAACALLIGVAARARPAAAQSFRLDRFRAVERPDDGFGVRRLSEVGHLAPAAMLGGSWSHDPLVIERRLSNREVQTVVDHQVTLQLALSLGLWERVTAFAGLEVVPLLRGPAVPVGFVPEASGAGMGDLTFGARVRLIGEPEDLFALGVQAALLLPTAGSDAYRGEGKVAALPLLIAELRPSIVRISLNAGALIRDPERLVDARVGSELLWGAGVGVKVLPPLELLGELSGGLGLRDFGARALTQSEFLLGARLATRVGLTFGVAAGRGFSGGIGSPDARVIGQLGYRTPPRIRQKAPEPLRVAAPSAPLDTDGDGLPDAHDDCPREPEDADGFEDGDGCPELDDDRDGVPDAADACRTEPEDRDDFEDADGCPDPDNDRDGVLDPDDKCRDQAGIVEEMGCPPKATLSEDGTVEILEQILFATNEAEILPASFPTLEAVAAVLARHASIARMRVEGHTDDIGAVLANLKLSRDRAGSVARWLIAHGVAASRLEAYGCGELHPATSAVTDEGRAKNRRVLFQVVDPPPSHSQRLKPPKGCRPHKLD
ncbi:MAG: OmpA family protein [Polyangiales bacterium]